jgi:hypothetical protein
VRAGFAKLGESVAMALALPMVVMSMCCDVQGIDITRFGECCLRRKSRRIAERRHCKGHDQTRRSSEELPQKQQRHVVQDRRGEQQAIGAVEHATVAGNDLADILHADHPLDQRFREIAEWADDAADDADERR